MNDAADVLASLLDSLSRPLELYGRNRSWSGHKEMPALIGLHDGALGTCRMYAELALSDSSFLPVHEEFVRYVAATAVGFSSSPYLWQKESLLALVELLDLDFTGRSWVSGVRARRILDSAVLMLETETAHVASALASTGAVESFGSFDLITGLARSMIAVHRVGRECDRGAIMRACHVLVSMLPTDGYPFESGAMILQAPFADRDEHVAAMRHQNLGTAHGLVGVASAAASVVSSVEIVSLTKAMLIGRLRTFLEKVADVADREGGTPMYLAADRGGASVPIQTRPSWCYGRAGLGTALMILGRHVFDADLVVRGSSLVVSATDQAGLSECADVTLCHGLAGALEALNMCASVSSSPSVASAQARCLGLLLERFDSDAPFGYYHTPASLETGGDFPGLLNGATGVAVAMIHAGVGSERFASPSGDYWATLRPWV